VEESKKGVRRKDILNSFQDLRGGFPWKRRVGRHGGTVRPYVVGEQPGNSLKQFNASQLKIEIRTKNNGGRQSKKDRWKKVNKGFCKKRYDTKQLEKTKKRNTLLESKESRSRGGVQKWRLIGKSRIV